LGKELASRTIEEMSVIEAPNLSHDPSTNALIQRYRQGRGRPV
jgi:glucose-6-phosphate isomerase